LTAVQYGRGGRRSKRPGGRSIRTNRRGIKRGKVHKRSLGQMISKSWKNNWQKRELNGKSAASRKEKETLGTTPEGGNNKRKIRNSRKEGGERKRNLQDKDQKGDLKPSNQTWGRGLGKRIVQGALNSMWMIRYPKTQEKKKTKGMGAFGVRGEETLLGTFWGEESNLTFLIRERE